MPRIPVIFTILVVLLSATLAVGGSASGAADDTPPPDASASEAWHTSSTDRPSVEELRWLEEVASGVPGNEIDSEGARSVPVGTTRRIVVASTRAGARCFVAAEGDNAPLRMCGHGFPRHGLAVSYLTGSDAPPSLVGLVAPGVTSATIVLADGSSRQLDIANGAVWWTGEVTDRIVLLASTRDGAAHVETDQFMSGDRA